MTVPGEGKPITGKTVLEVFENAHAPREALRFTGQFLDRVAQGHYPDNYAGSQVYARYSLYKTPKGYRVYEEQVAVFTRYDWEKVAPEPTLDSSTPAHKQGLVTSAQLHPSRLDTQTGNLEYSDYTSMEEVVEQCPPLLGFMRALLKAAYKLETLIS
jgi:hypothetical protein